MWIHPEYDKRHLFEYICTYNIHTHTWLGKVCLKPVQDLKMDSHQIDVQGTPQLTNSCLWFFFDDLDDWEVNHWLPSN